MLEDIIIWVSAQQGVNFVWAASVVVCDCLWVTGLVTCCCWVQVPDPGLLKGLATPLSRTDVPGPNGFIPGNTLIKWFLYTILSRQRMGVKVVPLYCFTPQTLNALRTCGA